MKGTINEGETERTESEDRILDFSATGMWWEITKSTADTRGELLEAINIIVAGFSGPPVHIHPHAEESYHVLEGTLVTHDGEYGPGHFVWFPEGSVMEHGATAAEDVTVLFITNKPFEIHYR